MEENEIVKKSNKGKKILLIVLLVLIVIAGGVFVYFKFFKKDNVNYFDIYNATFKTDDGKKLTFHVYSDETISKEAESVLRNSCLKICQNKDVIGCDSIKNNTGDVITYSNFLATHSDNLIEFNKYNRKLDSLNYNNYLREYAKFDGKTIGIYIFNSNTQYGLYAGNELSNGAKVPYDYYFLVNFNTGKVIQYNEEMNIITHIVYSEEYSNGRMLDTTYFAKKDKNSFKYKVYTMDLKYLGEILTTPGNMMDDEGHVYVMNDGIISVYDEKGNKVKSLPKVDNITDFTVFNNSCLAIIYENNKFYLYDFSNNTRVNLDIKNEGSVDSKTLVDNCYFSTTDSNNINDEVVINSTYKGFIYDYKNKAFKKTTNSIVYSNDKMTIELSEYDSKTNEYGTVTKYYYLYSNGKEIKVTSDASLNSGDVIKVGNDNSVYILNTKTKRLIAYYTSKNEILVNDEGSYEGIGWFEIFEKAYYKDMGGKLVSVVNTTNGEVLHLSNEVAVGVSVQDNILYVAYDKKIVKYSDAGKVLETITYDKIYSDENSILGTLYNLFVKKGNDYYMIDIFEKGFKLIKLEKSSLKSGTKAIDTYKVDDSTYIFVDNSFKEIDEKPEKEDDNYAIYSYSGGMCGSNVFVDKNTGKFIASDGVLDYVKTNNGYFFFEGECVTDWGVTYAYTSSWKELGISLRSDGLIDENGNIYVINNDTIELRNTKAELISKSKTYKRINGGLINDKMLYVSSIENNKLYLVILNEKLEEQSKVLISNLRGSEYYPEIEYRDGKITISIFDNETLVFAYDIKTKSVNEVKSTD